MRKLLNLLSDRIRGRVALEDIINPSNGEILVKATEEISDSVADLIDTLSIESIEVRSPLTCEAKRGYLFILLWT